MKKRLQKFESFKLNEGMINNDKYFLLSKSFINQYDDPKKGLYIHHVTLKTWVKDLTDPESVDNLTYSSLFRYLLYFWFHKEKINSIKEIREFKEKLMNEDEETIRLVERITRNRTIFNTMISKYIKTRDIKTTDYTPLTAFIEARTIIFNSENVLQMIKTVDSLTNGSNEQSVLNIINDKNGIDGLTNAVSISAEEIADVELIADSNDGQKRIHIISLTPGSIIEEPGNSKYNTLKIKNSSNEITTFNKWEDESPLPYDILFLNDVDNQKIYSIDSNHINKIFRFKNSNDIMINLLYRKTPKIFNTKS